MAVNGRLKGCNFERLVAKKILQAAGEPFTRADCSRTPLSGGHEACESTDLKISPRLLEFFPFGGEAKHHKTFSISQMFDLTKEIKGFHNQVLASLTKDLSSAYPLIIVRGNRTPIYAASYSRAFENYGTLSWLPRFTYVHNGQRWEMILFDNLLDVLRTKAQTARRDGLLSAA